MNVKTFFTIIWGSIIFFTLILALCSDKFKSFTTFSIFGDMTRNASGDGVDVESITK
ncbi:hypothetical protein [Bartonella grahamii]|uniref:hypothetical protein n=1 Tax=Bartonella grahamii TaxID=33045 RepID=UPI001ABB1D1C|nr:hypothetical protein [Bartonella grahamii]